MNNEIKQLETATTLHQNGNLDEAELIYQNILARNSAQIVALTMLGTLKIQKGLFEIGASLIKESLKLNPNQPGALTNLAHAFNMLGLPSDGLNACDKALNLAPDYLQSILIRGNSLNQLNRLEEAIDCYQRIIEINPSFVESHYNLANTLKQLKRYQEAIERYKTVLQMRPDLVEAYNNLGICYQDLNLCGEAIAYYDQALALNPDYVEANWNKALMKLMLGEFEEGWKLYEWGWKGAIPYRGPRRIYEQHLWLGDQSIVGKTLLVIAEQGLGDTIQFSRFASIAKQIGANVIIQVPSSLVRIISSIDSEILVLSQEQILPPFDFYCPMMSLPLALSKFTKHEIPSNTPYLYVPSKNSTKWGAIISKSATPKIGLVWSGSRKDQNDHNRSISLEHLLPLLSFSAEFHCLQKELSPSDFSKLKSVPKINIHTDVIEDFSDTAAIISMLDLIITVDTSVAHLAGAMGKPVWVLLPFAPDFRWMLNLNESAWYPTARLFRQANIDDWKSVIIQLSIEFKKSFYKFSN